MVEISEIRPGAAGSDDEYETESESGSVASLDAEAEKTLVTYDPSQETLADRIYALKDIVSPTTRETLFRSAAQSVSLGKKAASLVGSAGWYLTTTAILLGLPLALAVEGETVFAQQEKFEKEQQAGVQQMLGGSQPAGQPGQEKAGVLPAGF